MLVWPQYLKNTFEQTRFERGSKHVMAGSSFFDVVPTRYVIYLFSVIAIYAVVLLNQFWQSWAGRISIVVLVSWVLWQSVYVWMDGVTHGTLIGVRY